MKPWHDISYFYSLMTIVLSVLVASTVTSEFYRGGKVIAYQTGRNIFSSLYVLTRRNTRRYGGYIVHFAVVVVMIGFAGAAFNQDTERELGNGDSLSIGHYTVTCRTYTQDDNKNYSSDWAIMDISRDGQHVDTMYPERRVYKASQQPATMPAIRSTIREDLYLVYTGLNPDTGRPIIRAHLNPLVGWIWAGAHLLLIGTILALIPSIATTKIPIRSAAKVLTDSRQAVGAGD